MQRDHRYHPYRGDRHPRSFGSLTGATPLHRIAAVRRQQGLTLRTIARHLRLPPKELERQEDPQTDLTLSQVHRWQQVLKVPLANLLHDCDQPLSEPVQLRARLLRVMKTVQALLEVAPTTQVERLGELLERQLIEIMPELKEVGAWPVEGRRRKLTELGRIGEAPIPSSFAEDAMS